MSDFKTKTYAKFILAGEHAVLRGCPALVFPVKSKYLLVEYSHAEKPLEVKILGEHSEELQLLFWTLMEHALKKLNKKREDLHGELVLTMEVPLGAGLGASATICAGLSRWFCYLRYISQDEEYEFARGLEDLFHGESSGVDVAAALAGNGLKFIREGSRESLKINWHPQLYISYSGQKGVTSECIQKVKHLCQHQPALAESIDKNMLKAVELAETSLLSDSTKGLVGLTESIKLAEGCFQQWGLTKGPLEQMMSDLKQAGALAVKPTGSGGGGYVLSLWDKKPPSMLSNQLIKI